LRRETAIRVLTPSPRHTLDLSLKVDALKTLTLIFSSFNFYSYFFNNAQIFIFQRQWKTMTLRRAQREDTRKRPRLIKFAFLDLVITMFNSFILVSISSTNCQTEISGKGCAKGWVFFASFFVGIRDPPLMSLFIFCRSLHDGLPKTMPLCSNSSTTTSTTSPATCNLHKWLQLSKQAIEWIRFETKNTLSANSSSSSTISNQRPSRRKWSVPSLRPKTMMMMMMMAAVEAWDGKQ